MITISKEGKVYRSVISHLLLNQKNMVEKIFLWGFKKRYRNMLNDGMSLECAFILRINRAIIQLPTFMSALSVFCLMGFLPCVQKKNPVLSCL